LKLTTVPSRSEIHAVADWIELTAWADPDGETSLDSLVEARGLARDTGAAGAAADVGVMVAEFADRSDQSAPDDRAGLFDDSPAAEDVGDSPDEGDQEARRVAAVDPERDPPADDEPPVSPATEESGDVWSVLRDRSRILGSSGYPFILESQRSIRVREALGPAHQLYLLLLLASNLGRLSQTEWTGLTTAFERLSARVVASWLGDAYRVELFGTSTQAGDRYHGDLRTALKLLGDDLGWPLHEGIEHELSSSGDRGLDVVAWREADSDDRADLWPTYFCQCGCGKDWPGKQDEPSRDRWMRLLAIKGPLQSVLLIPYWLRRPGGAWHRSTWLSGANVALDRQRILTLMDVDGAVSVIPAIVSRPLTPMVD
jgi:hypothetical protein